MFDIVVIGGNLAGVTAAIHAAEKGVNIALIERNKEPFYPAHCGEGIDDITAEWLNLDKISCKKNEIKNVIVNIASLKEYTFNLKKHRLIIFDRNCLEKTLLDKAGKIGVELYVGRNMRDFKSPNEIILDDDIRINGKIIIDASGIACQIGRRIGINTMLRQEDIGVCIQSRIQRSFDPDTVRMWYHKPYAPFGYAWVFPINESMANIGIGIPGGQKVDLSILLKNYIDDLIGNSYKITNTFRACVPSASPLNPVVKDNVMIVGDAARLANATTGSGIENAIFSGGLAGKIAANYVNGKISSLKLYQYLMQNKILTLKKVYMRKTKLTTDKKYINAYKLSYNILFLINKLAPSLLQNRVAKKIKRDKLILESYH
jgi:digeranylgeranylglycerophospholipid reductase